MYLYRYICIYQILIIWDDIYNFEEENNIQQLNECACINRNLHTLESSGDGIMMPGIFIGVGLS